MSSKAVDRFFRLLKKHGFTATGRRRFKLKGKHRFKSEAKRRFRLESEWVSDCLIRSGCRHCPLTLVASKEGFLRPKRFSGKVDYKAAGDFLGLSEKECYEIVRAADAADDFSGPLRTRLLKTLDLKEPNNVEQGR